MHSNNKVFIATSIDGFIADSEGKVDWLDTIPNPDNNDMGYYEFMTGIDALIMGRNSFETVLSFGIDWPYKVPVFILSHTLAEIPSQVKNQKIELIKGDLKKITKSLYARGFEKLYIDGGKTIQNFLREDLVDEMTITIIPVLLGDGIPLFSHNSRSLEFSCVNTKIYLDKIVQNKFVRRRE